MITLLPNTSGQKIYTTAYQGRALLDESFSDYLIIFYQALGSIEYALIGEIDTDNSRYTAFYIDTDADAPTSGNVLIPSDINGIFNYYIYGQNSATNLDPMDADVVGIVEQGLLRVGNPTETFEANNVPEPTFKSYAG